MHSSNLYVFALKKRWKGSPNKNPSANCATVVENSRTERNTCAKRKQKHTKERRWQGRWTEKQKDDENAKTRRKNKTEQDYDYDIAIG